MYNITPDIMYPEYINIINLEDFKRLGSNLSECPSELYNLNPNVADKADTITNINPTPPKNKFTLLWKRNIFGVFSGTITDNLIV